MARPSEVEFSNTTQNAALARQKNRCASCGSRISRLGESGRVKHRFGEIAHAHHMKNAVAGGTADVWNCVILCQSCHYSVHEGGNYRFGTVRISSARDYAYFNG
jgi:5-methylcytosine-specific restriction endonuclease McrA